MAGRSGRRSRAAPGCRGTACLRVRGPRGRSRRAGRACRRCPRGSADRAPHRRRGHSCPVNRGTGCAGPLRPARPAASASVWRPAAAGPAGPLRPARPAASASVWRPAAAGPASPLRPAAVRSAGLRSGGPVGGPAVRRCRPAVRRCRELGVQSVPDGRRGRNGQGERSFRSCDLLAYRYRRVGGADLRLDAAALPQ